MLQKPSQKTAFLGMGQYLNWDGVDFSDGWIFIAIWFILLHGTRCFNIDSEQVEPFHSHRKLEDPSEHAVEGFSNVHSSMNTGCEGWTRWPHRWSITRLRDLAAYNKKSVRQTHGYYEVVFENVINLYDRNVLSEPLPMSPGLLMHRVKLRLRRHGLSSSWR